MPSLTSQLFVAIAFTVDFHIGGRADGPLFMAGERYNFTEDHAVAHIQAGDARFVDVVHCGVVDSDHPLPAAELAALRDRMLALTIVPSTPTPAAPPIVVPDVEIAWPTAPAPAQE